ncbi:MAG: RluA family pseudouridine synthase [Anaerolineae bacterium]|nr:RluA family pseudouridine synthase [Thermoflexales bacterium]MDW8407433.1 RluA family pseudouridine synthase [Anaerolineae bacterium]
MQDSFRHCAFATPRADRLDKILTALLPDLTRSAAQRLIEQGYVHVGGVVRDAAYRARVGETIEVWLPKSPAEPDLLPEAIPLDILYEDEEVLAINKPAGLVVHPGAGNPMGTLANALLSHAPQLAAVGEKDRPGIVHRLDKETSGIVLIAKTPAAHRALQEQFKSRAVKKLYLALCVGAVTPTRGVINKPIGRDPSNRKRMAVTITGRPAMTEYAVAEVFTPGGRTIDVFPNGDQTAGWPQSIRLPAKASYSLVRAWPTTGRTHQLRVHFKSIGFPIVGDAVYGATRRDPLSRALAPRQMLHAGELTFILPASGQTCTLYAPLPADMRRLMDALSS